MKTVQVTWLSVLVYTLGALFLCYEMALQVAPSIMTHDLMRDLHMTAAGLGMMSGVYFYSYTSMQIPAGLLFDRFNTRYLLVGAILVCVAGALFFSHTSMAVMAGLGRFLEGIGSACAFIAVLVIAARWFPSKYFALLVGIAQLLAALGAFAGTEPLAHAVANWGWRATIQYMAYFGLVLALLCWVFVRDRGICCGDELKSLSIGESLRTITRNPQTWWCALYAFCSWAPIAAFAGLWGVPFIMKAYHLNAIAAGNIIGMIWLGLGFISPFLGGLSDWIGRRCILMTVTALIGMVASFCVLFIPDLPHTWMVGLMLCYGIATSGQIISFAVVKDINHPRVTATAIGVNNMAVVAPGAILQPLIGYLLQSHWMGAYEHGIPVYSVGNYQAALVVIPLCFAVASVVSFVLIKETYCQPQYR